MQSLIGSCDPGKVLILGGVPRLTVRTVSDGSARMCVGFFLRSQDSIGRCLGGADTCGGNFFFVNFRNRLGVA